MPAQAYQRKPELVQALQYKGNNAQEMASFCPEVELVGGVPYLKGHALVSGDWVWQDPPQLGSRWWWANDFELNYMRYTGPPVSG
jgi:hypothetical protein